MAEKKKEEKESKETEVFILKLENTTVWLSDISRLTTWKVEILRRAWQYYNSCWAITWIFIQTFGSIVYWWEFHQNNTAPKRKIMGPRKIVYFGMVSFKKKTMISKSRSNIFYELFQVTFTNPKLGDEVTIASLNLTNPTKDRYAFKIKCTSNQLFKIKSPVGYINPEESLTIPVRVLNS